MTEYLFPDNTVLCNFAAVNRLDLMKSVLNGRGRWTEAVAYEAAESARFLPALAHLPFAGWLDEPIAITDEADKRFIEQIRRAAFGGTRKKPLQHLGEAQTCHIIKNRAEFSGSWWISDDRSAIRYARLQGITTHETIDLMSAAVVKGHISASEAYDLMSDMAHAGRHPRLPGSPAELAR